MMESRDYISSVNIWLTKHSARSRVNGWMSVEYLRSNTSPIPRPILLYLGLTRIATFPADPNSTSATGDFPWPVPSSSRRC